MSGRTRSDSSVQQLPRSVSTHWRWCCAECGDGGSAGAKLSRRCRRRRRMFCGLTSRCTNPLACSTASASASCSAGWSGYRTNCLYVACSEWRTPRSTNNAQRATLAAAQHVLLSCRTCCCTAARTAVQLYMLMYGSYIIRIRMLNTSRACSFAAHLLDNGYNFSV